MRGRRSGRERSVLVGLLRVNGAWYVGHPNGEVGWTVNLRAARTARLASRPEAAIEVTAVPLEDGSERAAVIMATADQQPFPGNLLYRAARRHILSEGRYFRLEAEPAAGARPPSPVARGLSRSNEAERGAPSDLTRGAGIGARSPPSMALGPVVRGIREWGPPSLPVSLVVRVLPRVRECVTRIAGRCGTRRRPRPGSTGAALGNEARKVSRAWRPASRHAGRWRPRTRGATPRTAPPTSHRRGAMPCSAGSPKRRAGRGWRRPGSPQYGG